MYVVPHTWRRRHPSHVNRLGCEPGPPRRDYDSPPEACVAGRRTERGGAGDYRSCQHRRTQPRGVWVWPRRQGVAAKAKKCGRKGRHFGRLSYSRWRKQLEMSGIASSPFVFAEPQDLLPCSVYIRGDVGSCRAQNAELGQTRNSRIASSLWTMILRLCKIPAPNGPMSDTTTRLWVDIYSLLQHAYCAIYKRIRFGNRSLLLRYHSALGTLTGNGKRDFTIGEIDTRSSSALVKRSNGNGIVWFAWRPEVRVMGRLSPTRYPKLAPTLCLSFRYSGEIDSSSYSASLQPISYVTKWHKAFVGSVHRSDRSKTPNCLRCLKTAIMRLLTPIDALTSRGERPIREWLLVRMTVVFPFVTFLLVAALVSLSTKVLVHDMDNSALHTTE
ncbi:hypothetical protein B0J17DRAFT_627559 [Rhizoctonia solani]|nr:hypothetical protein B0J17DRAFT_627559 [Rhizoctonia solani]